MTCRGERHSWLEGVDVAALVQRDEDMRSVDEETSPFLPFGACIECRQMMGLRLLRRCETCLSMVCEDCRESHEA